MELESRKGKILISDDSAINREILKAIFEQDYELLEAEDGEETIRLVDQYRDSLRLVFLDLVMPKKSGMDVLAHMKRMDMLESLPVIIVTGEATEDSDLRAYEYGAADIIYKPFSRNVILRRALNIMEQYGSRHRMEELLEEKTAELMESQRKIEQNNEFLINALSSVVEFRSQESGQHINRVKNLSKIMLEYWSALHPEAGFTRHDIEQMVNAAALHDLGKIAIPDEILMKPGRLTAEEFETMKKHTVLGCEILEHFKQEDNEFYQYCYDICRHHHERYNGKGYPDGLKGDEISVWAQVVSIVDVFDALISPRVYKAAFPVPEAIRMIEEGECGVFNPELLRCFHIAQQDIVNCAAALDSIPGN